MAATSSIKFLEFSHIFGKMKCIRNICTSLQNEARNSNKYSIIACSQYLLPLRQSFSIGNGKTLSRKFTQTAVCLKKVVEEEVIEDDVSYANVLIKFSGYDPAVLDGYRHFINQSAKLMDLEITKQFNLKTEFVKHTLANSAKSIRKHKVKYQLKAHSRMIQIKRIPSISADIFFEHIQQNLPEGVTMDIDLKKWQYYVSPEKEAQDEMRKGNALKSDSWRKK